MTDQREAELCDAIRVLTERLIDAESRIALWEATPTHDPTLVTELLRRGRASARDVPLIVRALGGDVDERTIDIEVLARFSITTYPVDISAIGIRGQVHVGDPRLRPSFQILHPVRFR